MRPRCVEMGGLAGGGVARGAGGGGLRQCARRGSANIFVAISRARDKAAGPEQLPGISGAIERHCSREASMFAGMDVEDWCSERPKPRLFAPFGRRMCHQELPPRRV
jgi:hypothetical protein